jgi:hypothetical protein
MANNKLSDIIKSAAEVNLRYSANLLNLSKDYVKAFSKAVTNEMSSDEDDNAPEPRPTQPLLIVAGRKGETANAAFAINNTSQMSGSVTLSINGDFADSKVTVEPDTLSLKNGEGAIIRILATIGSKTSVDQDYQGAVRINELGIQLAEFIVRRLPDIKAPKKASPRRPRTAKKG